MTSNTINAIALYNLGVMYRNGEGVSRDDAEAAKWFRMAAEQGNPDAQVNLGLMYRYGEGVQRSVSEAVEWYRKAAEQGNADGQLFLGLMYDEGAGVPRNLDEALKWYRMSANQGNSSAQFNIGSKYRRGNGVPQNDTWAANWYRKSAEKGHMIAQYELGSMYMDGTGVPQDNIEAEKWYRNAAEQGLDIAQYHLGKMYHYGRGVDEDEEEAVKWYQKAAEQGHKGAQHELDMLCQDGPQDKIDDRKTDKKLKTKDIYLQDIKQGDKIASTFLVAEKSMAFSQKGSAYLNVRLKDKTGEMDGKVWENAAEMDQIFKKGDIIYIEGRVQSYRNALQVSIVNIKPCAPGNIDPSDYLPGGKGDAVNTSGVKNKQAIAEDILQEGSSVEPEATEFLITSRDENGRRLHSAWVPASMTSGMNSSTPQNAREETSDAVNTSGVNEDRQLREAKECKALLDACTPHLYMQNAFRISGISVDASMRDIKRRIDDLKAAEKMDDLKDELSHAFALDPAPSLDQIHESAQRLQEPERRIIDEFFWFWPFEPGKCNIDPALKALMDDDKSEAIKIWSNALSDNHANKSTVAKHNLAVIYHIQALDSEQYALNNELSAEQLSTITNYWYTCFKWWEELADDERLWSMVADRIRTIDDHRLTTGFARRMRATLPEAMDKINAMLASAYAELDKYSQAANHIKYMNETHQGKDNVPKILSIIIKPLKARVDKAVDAATNTANNKPDEAATAAIELLQAIKEPLKIIQVILPQEDHERIDICDTVAEACLKCQTAYARTSKDWKKSIEILGAALNYAASTETKEHLKNEQSNIVTNEHIDYLNKKIDQIEKSPISISNKMNLINNDLLPHLSKMKNSLSISKDRYEKCADNVAYFLRALSVSEYNDNKHLEEALRLIDISLSIVCGNDARKKMKEDRAVLLEFQKKNVIYAYIESLSKIIDEIENSNHNISSKMNIIQNHLFPYLAKIKNSAGMSDDIYEECADYVARYLRGLSVSEFNEHNNLKAALSILDISISIARGQEERQKLQEDKAQLVNIQKETTKHNLHITIRSDEIEITNQFVRYNNQKFHISSIQGIKYGVFVQVINGIRSSSYLIDIAGGQSGSIHIECKRVLRSEGQAEQDFNGILDALFHQVIPHVVQRLAEQVVTGMPLQVGGCRLTNKGMYITTGALLWKKETLVPLSDVQFSSGSGQVWISSVKDKEISTSMAIRDVWNAALLEFITKAVVLMKAKR